MSSNPPKTHPEREETDESLRAERQRTDDELSRRRAAIEEHSDALVQGARNRADHLLGRARGYADEKFDADRPSLEQQQALWQERAREDAVLRQERRTADDELTRERDARKRALAALLALEREQTDERLRTERDRADSTVTARDDFMAMVSHDLRTLLGGIALQAAVQIRDAADDDQGRRTVKAARKIQQFTARMNRLIGDLVDVVSIEAGRLAIAPERDDAAVLIRETLEAFQPLAAAKGIAVDADVKSGSVLATFDHDRVFQVLANLLSNAIKFTGADGRISIAVEPAGAEVRFSVRDTGTGIPPDRLEAVFERYWQVARGDRRGLGLGLFISKCIVEAHGGRMWATSEVGQGSTFFFTLPRDRAGGHQ